MLPKVFLFPISKLRTLFRDASLLLLQIFLTQTSMFITELSFPVR